MRLSLNLILVLLLFSSIIALSVDLSHLAPDVSQKSISGIAASNRNITSPMNPNELSKAGYISMRSHIGRSEASKKPKPWPKGLIPYEAYKIALPHPSWKMLHKAMATIEYWTCVRFLPYHGQEDFLLIIDGKNKGCTTNGIVGYKGGRHEIYLEAPQCYENLGVLMHKLLHVIGLVDEHRRPERDQYLYVYDDHILDERKNHFTKYDQDEFDNYGVPYDYSSIMHYNQSAYTKSGQITLAPRMPGAHIGQRDGMSVRDALKVNNMYQCFYAINKSIPYSSLLPDIYSTTDDKDELNIIFLKGDEE